MDTAKLSVGMEVKNYKELCSLLGIKPVSGNSKKYQMIDMDRYFQYEKKGHKFIITEVYEVEKEKVVNKGAINPIPFIDEMELLLINLLVKNNNDSVTISSSKLMLELCMVNPNYHKYFMNKESLSKLLDMDIGYIMDFYDTTNSTFKNAINTVTKRLENKKLLVHEQVMMVQFVDTQVELTPTGYVKADSILSYDDDKEEYTSKTVKPKIITRPATDDEKVIILEVERNVLKYKYKMNNIQEVFFSGNIYNYYKDVSDILFKELNIKKAYKANRYTYNVDNLIEQRYEILKEHEITELQDKLNMKVMLRIDENSNKRYEQAMNELLEYDRLPKKAYRVDNEYVDNINTVSTSLIDIHNTDSLDTMEEDEGLLNDFMNSQN